MTDLSFHEERKLQKVDANPTGKGTNWTLLRTKPVHVQIARMHVMGKSGKEIAKIVEWAPESIYRLLATPLMKSEIARLQGNIDNILVEADGRLKALVHRSIDVLAETLGDPNYGEPAKGDLDQQHKVAFMVLKSVLDLNRKSGGVHLTQIQNIQQVIQETQVKSDKELVKDTISRIRETQNE